MYSVRHFAFFAAFFVLILGLGGSHLSGEIITFDDIDASAGDVVLDALSPYHGYVWSNLSVYSTAPGFPGFNAGIISGPNAAYTSGDALGVPIVSEITSATPFDFLSVYIGSGWLNGLNATIQGYSSGVQTFSQTFTIDTQGAQLITADFTNITQLDIYSMITGSTSDPYGCGFSGCSQVTLDDLILTPSSSSPEPTTLFMVACGVVILAIRCRKMFSHV